MSIPNEEELTQAWLDAQSVMRDAQVNKRSTTAADVAATNRLSDAAKKEEVAWANLIAFRAKVLNGRT